MSERGAEGILKARAEAAKAQPVDSGTAGDPAPAKSPGRVKSAAVGAAGGSVGGPGGAAVGAVTGLLSGGKGKRTGGNKALVAEFVICLVLLGLSPLADKGGDVTVGKFLKKGSATAAVFIILGFISASGQTGRKVANGLGLLVALTVLLNERSVFGVLVKAVGGESVPVTAARSTSNTDVTGPVGGQGELLSLQDQLEFGGSFAADAGTATHNFLAGIGTSIANDSRVTSAADVPSDPIVDFFKGIFG